MTSESSYHPPDLWGSGLSVIQTPFPSLAPLTSAWCARSCWETNKLHLPAAHNKNLFPAHAVYSTWVGRGLWFHCHSEPGWQSSHHLSIVGSPAREEKFLGGALWGEVNAPPVLFVVPLLHLLEFFPLLCCFWKFLQIGWKHRVLSISLGSHSMLGFICALPELRALWGEVHVAFSSA